MILSVYYRHQHNLLLYQANWCHASCMGVTLPCTFLKLIVVYYYHHTLLHQALVNKYEKFQLVKWVISNSNCKMTLQRVYKRSRTFFGISFTLMWFAGIRYRGRNLNKKITDLARIYICKYSLGRQLLTRTTVP